MSIAGNKMLFKNVQGITIREKELDKDELKSDSGTIKYNEVKAIYETITKNL